MSRRHARFFNWKQRAASAGNFQNFKRPNFEEKFWDVIGLYLDPPEKALVLCCDGKGQCQAPLAREE